MKLPSCQDCRHYRTSQWHDIEMCNAEAAQTICEVDGTPTHYPAAWMRTSPELCGREARHFEPKEQKPH